MEKWNEINGRLSFQTLLQQVKNNTLEGAGSAVNEFQGQRQVKRSTANKKHTGTHAKETTKTTVSKENGDKKNIRRKRLEVISRTRVRTMKSSPLETKAGQKKRQNYKIQQQKRKENSTIVLEKKTKTPLPYLRGIQLPPWALADLSQHFTRPLRG